VVKTGWLGAKVPIVYVDANDNCNGHENCYDNIQDSIAAAQSGATIKIMAGDYDGFSTTVAKSLQVQITDSAYAGADNADVTGPVRLGDGTFGIAQGCLVLQPTTTPVEEDVHVTYTFDGQVYRIQAEAGAVPENISQQLDALYPLSLDGGDSWLNTSPDGQ